jgi:hypothetical protein
MILRRKANNFHVTTIGLNAVILKASISDVIWNFKFVNNTYVWVHSEGILCGIFVSRSDVATLFFEPLFRLCPVIVISAVPCHCYFGCALSLLFRLCPVIVISAVPCHCYFGCALSLLFHQQSVLLIPIYLPPTLCT